MKVLKRVILAGIVLVLALGLGAYFAIKLAFPPQKIKDLVHKHGSAALGRDVSVSEVSIRIFPNIKLSVREINVANAPGFSPDPCIKLREAALSINFLSLLKFSPVINEIKLVNPEFLYEVAADGRNNLEGLGGKKDSVAEVAKDSAAALESPAAVALKSFILEDGRVRYRDAKTKREIVLDRINQVVSLDLDQRLENVSTEGKLEISEIKITDPGLGLKQGNIKIIVRHDLHANLPAERVQVKSLELGFQDIRARVKGEATRFLTGPPVLDLELDAPEIRLASVLKEVPTSLSPDVAKLSAKGVASLKARIDGALDSASQPDVFAHLTVRDGGVSHRDLPAGVENLNLDLRVAGDTLRLSRFAFDMAGNPVSAEALLTAIRQPVPFLNALAVDAVLDLGKLVPLLEKMALVDSVAASGLVQAKVGGSGPLDPQAPQNLKVQGQVDLKAVTVKAPQLPQSVAATGQVRIDNDKITETLQIKTGESDVKVDGTVTNYLAMVLPEAAKGATTKAKLSIASVYLNLDELMPKGGKQEQAEEAPPATAWPSLPKLDADIALKLAKTRLVGLDMTDFTADAKLAQAVLNAALKGRLYSGTFSGTLRADLKDTSNAGFDLKFKVDRVEANDFISRLNDRLPGTNRLFKSFSRLDSAIFGKFNLDLDVKTHGSPATVADNLTGEIDFGLFDGKILETGLIRGLSDALGKVSKAISLKDLSFSKFTGNLEARAGKLVVKHVDVESSPVGSLAALGSIGFDNTLDITLENHLPPDISKSVAGVSGALSAELAKAAKVPGLANASLVPTDKAGRAILYYAVGGTLARPTFGLDMQRMAAEGAGGAKAALAAELRKTTDAAKAQLGAKRDSLEAEARAKAEEERRKLEAQAEVEKKKAAEQAKKKGKDVLKGLGL